MVEFALVLPIFCILLFAIIQFGIAFNNYLTLTDAVRAGARTAAVSRHLTTTRENVVEDKIERAAVNLDIDKLEIDIDSSWNPGSDVTVTATYPYEINVMGVAVKSGRLTSTTVERVE